MQEKSADTKKLVRTRFEYCECCCNMGFTSNAGKRAAIATKMRVLRGRTGNTTPPYLN